MGANEIHVDDVGTIFEVDVSDNGVVVDLSSASLEMIFTKPDTTQITKSPTLVTDGTDGKISYTTESGFLNQAGHWCFQVKVTIGSNVWYSDVNKFFVYRNH